MSLIDKQKVILGQALRLTNQKKKFNQNQIYVSIQVQNQNGNNERCLLFTEVQLRDMQTIKIPFEMILGRLYKAQINKRQCYLLKIRSYTQKYIILKISPYQLSYVQNRSLRNPQDLTKKSLLTDLID